MESQEKHLDQLNQAPDVADKVKGYRPEIVVKFPDEVRLPLGETDQDDDDEDYSREVGEYVRKAGLVDLDELEERYGDVTTQARFSGFDPDVLERIVEDRRERPGLQAGRLQFLPQHRIPAGYGWRDPG